MVERAEVQEAVDKAQEDSEKLTHFFEKVKGTVKDNPGLAVEEIDELLADAEELAPEVEV